MFATRYEFFFVLSYADVCDPRIMRDESHRFKIWEVFVVIENINISIYASNNKAFNFPSNNTNQWLMYASHPKMQFEWWIRHNWFINQILGM